MLIQCTIERVNGTSVTIGKGKSARNYHFTPDKDGMHVCEVKDKNDIARFLSIKESYCIPGAEPEPEDEDNENNNESPEGSDDDGFDEKPLDKWTDAELSAHAVTTFGINDADDKDELVEFACEMLNLDSLKKTMKAPTMIRTMIESANDQGLYQ